MFSEVLKKAKKILKLTNAEMAELLEVPLRTYENWAGNINVPTEPVRKRSFELIAKKGGALIQQKDFLSIDDGGEFQNSFSVYSRTLSLEDLLLRLKPDVELLISEESNLDDCIFVGFPEMAIEGLTEEKLKQSVQAMTMVNDFLQIVL